MDGQTDKQTDALPCEYSSFKISFYSFNIVFYAGLINDFLSWGVWASIAKISFMTYLFHMSPNFDFFAAMGYNVDVSMWLFTEVFVAQLFVDLFYGLLGCLFLELPFGKVQKILIEYILSIKSIKIIRH